MQIDRTQLDGVVVVTPQRFGDDRGWFSETWSARRLSELGLAASFVQDNHSMSGQKHTLRGLHYQAPPFAQDKLVRCARGSFLDVAVDARVGSPSFGQAASFLLSAENGKQLWIPKGFLHGFLTLEDNTEIIYKCSDYYAPESEGAVLWSSVPVNWNKVEHPKLSERDAAAPAFSDWSSPFTYEGAS